MSDELDIGPSLLSPRIAEPEPAPRPELAAAATGKFDGRALPRLKDAVEELERGLLAESLRRHAGNRSQVARELGIARSNLILKLAKYGLDT